ncbi:hypothetical protein WKH33_11790 [Priestia sp. WB3]|uniref:hypothetical protein n=1 Tax=Bacillus pumilus TaxID=1408 RepID=UPI001C21EBC7|nr:hypothetical protein [Bacillus pumilus]MBU8576651.1 hypothetical protein [Bacillus pumilus]
MQHSFINYGTYQKQMSEIGCSSLADDLYIQLVERVKGGETEAIELTGNITLGDKDSDGNYKLSLVTVSFNAHMNDDGVCEMSFERVNVSEVDW